MNIKQKIIRTVDIAFYVAFAIVFAFAAGGAMSGQIGFGIAVFAIGWVVLSILSGTWFVLSSVADNTKRMVELLEKQHGG